MPPSVCCAPRSTASAPIIINACTPPCRLFEAHDASLEWRERRDLALEAIDVARRAGDDTAFVEVLTNTFPAGDRSIAIRRSPNVERAVAIADRLGDPYCAAPFASRCCGPIQRRLAGARLRSIDMAAADQSDCKNSGPTAAGANGAAQIRVAEPVGDRDRPLDIAIV